MKRRWNIIEVVVELLLQMFAWGGACKLKKNLIFYIISLIFKYRIRGTPIGMWRSLVSRLIWDQENFRGFESCHPDHLVLWQFYIWVGGRDFWRWVIYCRMFIYNFSLHYTHCKNNKHFIYLPFVHLITLFVLCLRYGFGLWFVVCGLIIGYWLMNWWINDYWLGKIIPAPTHRQKNNDLTIVKFY